MSLNVREKSPHFFYVFIMSRAYFVAVTEIGRMSKIFTLEVSTFFAELKLQ